MYGVGMECNNQHSTWRYKCMRDNGQRLFNTVAQVPGIITQAELNDLKNGLQYKDPPPRSVFRPKKQKKQASKDW
jgi:hypothetical protein